MKLVPLGMKNALPVDAFILVRPEVISLGLDEVGGQFCAAIGIKIRERSHKRRNGNSFIRRMLN
jgi:hypothetical protein